MNAHRNPPGRILSHGKGLGEVTQRDIDQRAEENAIIDGRPEGLLSADGRRQAREELAGNQLPDSGESDESVTASLSRDPADPVASRGERVQPGSDDDDQETLERLALEGLEEAQHEQMLADRMRKHS
ncbi:MAG TPA: hypothetical protein PLN52_12245 [Opitutaceae bacterium]|nr:hypothetical protein [Opitutaceae bacterium]